MHSEFPIGGANATICPRPIYAQTTKEIHVHHESELVLSNKSIASIGNAESSIFSFLDTHNLGVSCVANLNTSGEMDDANACDAYENNVADE